MSTEPRKNSSSFVFLIFSHTHFAQKFAFYLLLLSKKLSKSYPTLLQRRRGASDRRGSVF